MNYHFFFANILKNPPVTLEANESAGLSGLFSFVFYYFLGVEDRF